MKKTKKKKTKKNKVKIKRIQIISFYCKRNAAALAKRRARAVCDNMQSEIKAKPNTSRKKTGEKLPTTRCILEQHTV